MVVRCRLPGMARRRSSAAACRPAAHSACSSAVCATTPTGTCCFHMRSTRLHACSASPCSAHARSAVSYSAARSVGRQAAVPGAPPAAVWAAAAAAASLSRSRRSTSPKLPAPRATCIACCTACAAARSAGKLPGCCCCCCRCCCCAGGWAAAAAAAAAAGGPCCPTTASAPTAALLNALSNACHGWGSPVDRQAAARLAGCSPRRTAACIALWAVPTAGWAMGWRVCGSQPSGRSAMGMHGACKPLVDGPHCALRSRSF